MTVGMILAIASPAKTNIIVSIVNFGSSSPAW